MSEKKIGRWFVVNIATGGIVGPFEDEEDARDNSLQKYRPIYMEETDPAKVEEECPELVPGDLVSYGDNSDWFILKEESARGWYALRLEVENGEITPIFAGVLPREVFTLYRCGRKTWWKGKIKGEE